jgi:hypothetical protein
MEKTVQFTDGEVRFMTDTDWSWIVINAQRHGEADNGGWISLYDNEVKTFIAELSKFLKKSRERPTAIIETIIKDGEDTTLRINQRGTTFEVSLNDADIEVLRGVLNG